MAAPVSPEELERLVPKETDDFCTVIEKAGAFDEAVTQNLEWMFDLCGNLGAIRGDICESLSDFPCTTTTTTTSTSTTSTTSTTTNATTSTTTTTSTSTTSTTTTAEPENILVPGFGTKGLGFPYPSHRTVAGVGVISKVVVNLVGVSHNYPDDIRLLLVSPSGTKVVLMQDCGGSTLTPIVDVNLTLDDDAAEFMPDNAQLTSGTYKPTQYNPLVNFPDPAPPLPYGTTLSAFIGENADGVWELYAFDDETLDVGSIDNWSLTIT